MHGQNHIKFESNYFIIRVFVTVFKRSVSAPQLRNSTVVTAQLVQWLATGQKTGCHFRNVQKPRLTGRLWGTRSFLRNPNRRLYPWW